MRQLRSIRWRLLSWFGSLLALIVTGLAFTAYHVVDARQRQAIDERLQHALGEVVQAVRPPKPGQHDGSGSKVLHLNLLPPLSSGQDFYYVVWLKNTPGITASPNAPADVPHPPEGSGGVRTRGTLREAYITGQPGDYMLVGCSIAPEQAAMTHLAWLLAGGAAGFLTLGLIGGWLIISRSLRPIAAITTTAQKITKGDLSQRIDVTETESELGELAVVLNTTFARLDEAFAQQKRFTADAAHELRTPISVILTHAQNSLSDEQLPEEHREALEASQRAAQRMRRLVEMLLQLARLDRHEDSSSRVPCDLAQIVGESVDSLRPLAEERGIALQLALCPAPTQGDAERLGQVIANLVTNAIHHGKASGGEIRISTSTDTSSAICTVADNGPGIAPEHLAHVFERFYRVDKARTTHAGRTGLGLAISQAIVEAHGGSITVSSKTGEGATFVFRLPLKP